MNRRSFVIALALAATLASSPAAWAADHLADAIAATEEAIAKATAGSLDEFVAGVNTALKHAQAALKKTKDLKENTELKKAVTHLLAALHQGKSKSTQTATKHAEDALGHLKMASPTPPAGQ